MERLRGARPAPIHVLVLRCAHVLARQRRVFGAIGEARPGSRALARQRNCSGFRSGELHGQLTRHGGAFCSLCPKILSALNIYASCFCPLPPAPAQDDGKMWGPLASSDQNGPGLPSKSLDFVFRYSPLLARAPGVFCPALASSGLAALAAGSFFKEPRNQAASMKCQEQVTAIGTGIAPERVSSLAGNPH